MRNSIRNSLVIACIAICTSLSAAFAEQPEAAAQDASEVATRLYNDGNAAYREGRFADAVELYTQAANHNANNGAVFFNLGNANFRLGHLGRAILNYERSVRLDPRNDEAWNNLQFASLLITDHIENQASEIRVQELMRSTLNRIPDNWLAVGLSIGLFGVALVCAWWLLGGRRSGATIVTLVFAGLLFLGTASMAGLKEWVSDDGSAAIVLDPQIEVRFEPDPTAKVAFVLHEGTKVWVERDEADWTLVQIANGLRGWLPKRAIELI